MALGAFQNSRRRGRAKWSDFALHQAQIPTASIRGITLAEACIMKRETRLSPESPKP